MFNVLKNLMSLQVSTHPRKPLLLRQIHKPHHPQGFFLYAYFYCHLKSDKNT